MSRRTDTGDTDAGVDGGANRRVVDEPTNLWRRGENGADDAVHDDGNLLVGDLHLHRYCEVWPTTDGGDRVDAGQVRFLTGVARVGLRYTPVVVLLTAALFVVSAELAPGVGGVSEFLPYLRPLHLLVVVAAGLLWLPMLYLVMDVGIVARTDLLRGVVVYGLLSALTAGTLWSVYLVVTASDPTALPPNIVYTSGYLLLLFLGGLLVYDGMLRTEHLFENLADKLVVDDDKRDAYEAFRKRLRDDLTHTKTIFGHEIQTSHLFAPLFVAQFGVVWAASRGPQNLDFTVTLAANVLLDFFIVVVAFQFLVLIRRFHELVTGEVTAETDDGEEELLRCVLFHPDGRGGFRDFGKFVTRVNVLLILAGLYLVYRLYVQGARIDPTSMVPGLAADVGGVLWALSYVVPVLAYLVVAGAWLYYSFWQLHLKMARDREREYIDHQLRRRAEEGSEERLGAPTDSAQWGEIRASAPVWPIQNKQMVSIVSGTFAPLVLSLPKFLF